MIGISSWGVYIPRNRYPLGDGRKKMALFDPTEDVITMGYEASRIALERINLDPEQLTTIRLGCENTPYDVKPLASVIKDLLGVPRESPCSDINFACLAGIQSILDCDALLNKGFDDCGLAIATDYSIYPEDTKAEFTQGSGAAAFVLGREEVIATIEDFSYCSTDTPDFLKRRGQEFPFHFGEFTEDAYLDHVCDVGSRLKSLKNSRFVLFHMPYGSLAKEAGRRLGLSQNTYIPPIDLITRNVGNAYTASIPLALAWAFENSEKDDLITAIGYGSGAGSLGITFRLVDDPKRLLNKGFTVTEQVDQGMLVEDSFYQRWRSGSNPEYELVGNISSEPKGRFTRLVCSDCGAVYSPQSTIGKTGKCPRDDSVVREMNYLPVALLEDWREIKPYELRQAIADGEVPILNNRAVSLFKGKEMGLTVRRLYSDEENGPIYHGAVYKPL